MTIQALLYKLTKKAPVLAYDIGSILIAWYIAYWLRYNLQPFPTKITAVFSLKALLILMITQTGSYYYYKVYRGLWRFASISDMVRIIKSVLTATLLFIPLLHTVSLLHDIPRSVFPLYALVLITLLCAARLAKRINHDSGHKIAASHDRQRVLIIGAGKAGETIIRDLKCHSYYQIIGLVDDNPTKQGLEIHGIPVLGGCEELQHLVNEYQVELILIAIPSARSADMRRIVNYCEQCKIPFRTLPGLTAVASGQVTVNLLREVNIEDLLGRDEVKLEWDKIAANISGKRIVITGGGGSIGSELCRQVLALKPNKLLIIDNSEYNLYNIEQELQENYPHISIETALLSVTDQVGIEHCFQHFKPHVIFHAAAFKHVPMLEHQIRTAIQNNVIGTKIVAEASVLVRAEKFILISTDKAVNPTNIMGTTKRVAEIYCQNFNELVDTQFITVRFGNVLGSAGSVVPLFKKQLRMGGPLTVTHPEIERYFMTIPEACQLILQAAANGKGGEIFVLDMGEPIKIAYLAEQIIRLAGKVPGKDIPIVYTGLRPGEKLYEELFHESEQLSKTAHEKLFKAKFRKIDWQELTNTLYLITDACFENNADELQVLIKSLVPEFNAKSASELQAKLFN